MTKSGYDSIIKFLIQHNKIESTSNLEIVEYFNLTSTNVTVTYKKYIKEKNDWAIHKTIISLFDILLVSVAMNKK